MKYKKIYFLCFCLLFLGIIILGIKVFLLKEQLKNNSTIYCVMEDEKKENKMELYFDYKDGKIYKYSIINTNKMTDNINIDAYKQKMENNNQKYKGATGKFWTDSNIYVTSEIYNLDLLSEKEWKELTMFSKKDLQTKTRQEIIDSILPVTKGKTFHCN